MSKKDLSDKLGGDWEKSGEGNVWNFKDGDDDSFVGVFIDKKENVGVNNSTLYRFVRYEDIKDGGLINRLGHVGIWGTTTLNTKFEMLEKGDLVAIQYMGLVESEKRKGSQYHDFEVYTKKQDEKEEDEDNIDIDDILNDMSETDIEDTV